MTGPTKKQQAQAVLEAERRVLHTAQLLSAALRDLKRAQHTGRLPAALGFASRMQHDLVADVMAMEAARAVRVGR